MATIRDVAKEAGVSIATVSRILRNDPLFVSSEKTKKRVMETVKKLNYEFKPKNDNYNIGCIMPLTYNYGDEFFTNILFGIRNYYQNNNAIISLIVTYDEFKEMKQSLIKKINLLDGLIVMDYASEKINLFEKLKNRIIFIDCYAKNYTQVGYDEIETNKVLIDYLIDCNYKNIAYIGGPSNNEFLYSRRLMVFRNELEKNGLFYNKELIYNCEWNIEVCKEQVKDLLRHHPEVDAIFAGSDSLATSIISVLNSMNIKVPEDIGVVGFNDLQIVKDYNPPITTMHLPAVEMGELGAKLLLEQIKTNKNLGIRYNLNTELKIRESTKKKR